jgi:hypothetical protein
MYKQSSLKKHVFRHWFQLTLLLNNLTATVPLNHFTVLCCLGKQLFCRLPGLTNELLSYLAAVPLKHEPLELFLLKFSQSIVPCFCLSWKKKFFFILAFGVLRMFLITWERPNHEYVSQDADTRNQLRFFFYPLSIVLSLCFSLWFSLSLFLSHCLLSLFFFNFLNIILLLMILFCSTWKESEIQAWC